jgi:hypothetical protein
MSSRLLSRAAWLLLLLPLGLVPEAVGQAFKLEVGKTLRPQATLKIEGTKVTRSAVTEDPGFRLQYRFTKDGKDLPVINARANPSVDLPHKEPGKYTVVLEAFYPTYKPGKQQRGQFKPISNSFTYRVEPGPKAGEPGKIVDVVSVPLGGQPAVVIRCGKGKGQEELLAKGFGYKLLQGQPAEGVAGVVPNHRWQDPKEVRFELTLPAGTAGTLRLHFIEGEGQKGRQRILAQGKPRGEVTDFGGRGQILEIPLAAAEVSAGRVEVAVQNLNPSGSALISTVEFVPTPARP